MKTITADRKHDIIFGMKQRIGARISPTKTAILIAVLVGICIICLAAAQIWMAHQYEKEAIGNTHSFITLSEAITNSCVNQAIRLSQMLLLDLDVSRFIYQAPIPPGSSDIQTMIDTLHKLPTSRNVNPILSEIFIYSKASDYLLNSSNLFFDIDKMYTIFQFNGLSSLQFRSKYLTTRQTGFFPATTAMINGSLKRVIPYVQSFPLSNPSANSGKVILLLDEDFIASQLGAIEVSENGWYCIADMNNRIITSSNYEYAASPEIAALPDGPHENVMLHGNEFFVSVITSADTGLRYVCAIGEKEFNLGLAPIFFIFTLGMITLLAVAFAFGVFQFTRSQRNWNKLNALIGDARANSSYELIADTISSILEDERKTDKDRGSLSFKQGTFFRRYIHEKSLGDKELRALFDEIHGGQFDNGDSYKLMKIIMQEEEIATNIDDVDFFRIATGKEAMEAFQSSSYVFIDLSFNAWILAWNASESSLDRNIRRFWDRMNRIVPFDISLAVSGSKTDLEGLRHAAAECNAAERSIRDSFASAAIMDYDSLAGRSDSFLYTKDMEKALVTAASIGNPKATEEALDTIHGQNFKERSLNPKNAEALINSLHSTAVHYCVKRGNLDTPEKFSSFADARRFFLSQAGQAVMSRKEIEESAKNAIIAYIDKNYSNPSLNLSAAASDLQMKENYLYHFMSTRVGKTFSSYLEDFRLEKARRMIAEESGLAINAIAMRCGYINPQTFRRAFRKRFGQLPSDFRNAIPLSGVGINGGR